MRSVALMPFACLLACLVQLLTVTEALKEAQIDELWLNYKMKFNKVYGSVEDELRRNVFAVIINRIQLHNLQADLGQHSFTMGLNKYSDLTDQEYRKYLLGYRTPSTPNQSHTLRFTSDISDLPDTVDWRDKGYVTPVKDQGQCGSCWSFSSTGSLEGQNFKKTGKLVPLSEQNLVDCTTSLGNEGCNGGWMNVSFIYVQQNGGIDTEEGYPYEARDDTCRYDPSSVGGTCTGYENVSPAGDESALMSAVANVGPISVAIDAGHPSFQSYRSGIYDEPDCTTQADHAVLVVGYGSDGGQDYWLVKNSWSETWGQNGYIKMSRNKDNQCGIASYAMYPTV